MTTLDITRTNCSERTMTLFWGLSVVCWLYYISVNYRLNSCWHEYFLFSAWSIYLKIFPTWHYAFIHSVFCLTTGPKPPLKRLLHIVRSRASSFKWEHPLLSLRSSSSFLRFLPRLLVTSISPFIFPSITCFRRQFLRKMWPIQLAFRFLISCRIFFCSLTLSNTSSFLTWSVQLIFSILLQHHISKFSRYFWSAARSVLILKKILIIAFNHSVDGIPFIILH